MFGTRVQTLRDIYLYSDVEGGSLNIGWDNVILNFVTLNRRCNINVAIGQYIGRISITSVAIFWELEAICMRFLMAVNEDVTTVEDNVHSLDRGMLPKPGYTYESVI